MAKRTRKKKQRPSAVRMTARRRGDKVILDDALANVEESAVPNLVVVSDLHIGCGHGLFTLDSFQRDEAGLYVPSRHQRVVAGHWRSFWDEWVPMVCRGEPYAVAVNGDALDGVHHGSVHQWTHNLEDQCEAAYQMLAPIVERCGGRYYHLRGTEAHAGKSGQEEERLAKRLGALPDEDGHHARWELWIQVGHALAHIAHHIGTTGSSAYETSAVMKELSELHAEAAFSGEQPPDVICRSHRHRHIEVRKHTPRGFLTSFVTAGWQLRTPFAYRVPGGRIAPPQIGGSLIRSGDEDNYTRHQNWTIGRSKVENASRRPAVEAAP